MDAPGEEEKRYRWSSKRREASYFWEKRDVISEGDKYHRSGSETSPPGDRGVTSPGRKDTSIPLLLGEAYSMLEIVRIHLMEEQPPLERNVDLLREALV